jgi:hypothetical protein
MVFRRLFERHDLRGREQAAPVEQPESLTRLDVIAKTRNGRLAYWILGPGDHSRVRQRLTFGRGCAADSESDDGGDAANDTA